MADVRDVGGALGHMSGELDQTECGLLKGSLPPGQPLL